MTPLPDPARSAPKCTPPVAPEGQERTLCDQLAEALARQDVDGIERLADVLYDDGPQRAACLPVLHALMLATFHRSHQRVVRTLQALKDPRSVFFLRQALAAPWDHLAYNASDADVIAKWFSHALFDIGTPEALQVLREFADSPDPGIRAEMRYRLGQTGR